MLRAVAGLLVCVAGAVHAQTAAPQFEVASIKPSNPSLGTGDSGLVTSHDRVTASNVTLRRCIIGAWGVGPHQIFGGPAWLNVDRFEIVAKADRDVNAGAALMAMFQTLLADRFKLALHPETRNIQAFVLDVTKNGPKLEKAAGGGSSTNSGHGTIDARNMTMDRLAEVLSRQMELPVVNRTGIEGAYDLKLQWTPEINRPVKPGEAAPDGVSIFTAIQEQLGLRLRSEKTPIEVLVIDNAEKPTEN